MKIVCKVCNQPIELRKFFGGRVFKCKRCGYIFDLSNNIILSLFNITVTTIMLIMTEYATIFLQGWTNISYFVSTLIVLPMSVLFICFFITPLYQKIFLYFWANKKSELTKTHSAPTWINHPKMTRNFSAHVRVSTRRRRLIAKVDSEQKALWARLQANSRRERDFSRKRRNSGACDWFFVQKKVALV